jgi:tetratricopeptide (TPR) repeat protein/tRNA A-37 threonylcarbamoyl transferase component Bud32
VTERWAQVKALLSATMDLPLAQRAEFLAREADLDVVREVRSLLNFHEQPGEFLEPVSQELRSLAFAASNAARSRIGERVGAYRFVGVLGTGGMGDVFKAVRDDDLYQAEVAIKLMRADMRSALTEQRFKTERQILAGLDHRNIARLLDGGTTNAGMPYVVMELVTGDPIDGYCEARHLNVRDRVQLFLQVCAAVSYAHQHLIVHRDLKPNNILVTADGSVKLLDFGIAKLLENNADSPLAEADATVTTLRAMTLEYASPEQVSGGKVTTVSDVYSLGVVLYRLLTGKSPYSVRTNDAQRMAEILSDTTPTRPSLVKRKIDVDLDNILLMALRKEPQRRYGSVEQLANDLRNHLTGMPVRARGNSLPYRAGKLIKRRKVEIAAGVLVACTLSGALGVSLRETRVAEQQRRVAQQHFNSVRKLANTLLFELHDEMEKVPGSTRTREMLVKTSLEYLDSLYKEAADPTLQQELGVAYSKVGDIQGRQRASNLGDHQGALRSYARAIGLLEPLLLANPDNHNAAITLANSHVQRASVMLIAGKLPEALVSVRKGVALTERLRPFFSNDADRFGRLHDAYWAQADILAALGRTPETISTLDKLLALAEEFLRSHPNDEHALSMLSDAYSNASLHADLRLSETAQYERAIALLRRSASTGEQLVALVPNSARYRAALARTQQNLARQLAAQNDFTGALTLHQLSSPVLRAAAADPNDARAHWASALADSHLAATLFELGRVDEAKAILLECQAVLDRLQKQSPSLRIEYALGQNGVRLGVLYSSLANNPKLSPATRLGYWRQAQDSLRQSVASLQKVAASVALEPLDRKVLDAGIAALARAESAIAKF